VPRIQILELPEGAIDDRPPFVVIVDQADTEAFTDQLLAQGNIAEQLGARAVLCFEDTVEIPANEVTLATDDDGTPTSRVRVRLEPDLTGFHEAVEQALTAARERATAALQDVRRAHG
jgi:hypothetical protein